MRQSPRLRSMDYKDVTIIAGPTASGKTSLAIRLAKERDGEVISADSRQIYRGLDLATGKVTAKEADGVPHHLIDICHPNDRYSVEDWRAAALAALADIRARGKHPIVAGGTGLYLSALLTGAQYPNVEPNESLRAELAKKTTGQLFDQLTKLDARRADAIDSNNRHRLIRAIEIATALGNVPEVTYDPLPYSYELITLMPNRDTLRGNITTRLHERLEAGMVDEIQRAHDDMDVSWDRLRELGLEMRYIADRLTGELSYDDMVEQLDTAIWHYAKRQFTWITHQLLPAEPQT